MAKYCNVLMELNKSTHFLFQGKDGNLEQVRPIQTYEFKARAINPSSQNPPVDTYINFSMAVDVLGKMIFIDTQDQNPYKKDLNQKNMNDEIKLFCEKLQTFLIVKFEVELYNWGTGGREIIPISQDLMVSLGAQQKNREFALVNVQAPIEISTFPNSQTIIGTIRYAGNTNKNAASAAAKSDNSKSQSAAAEK